MWFDIAVIVLRAGGVTVCFERVYLKSGLLSVREILIHRKDEYTAMLDIAY
jgi:hypothetical protein